MPPSPESDEKLARALHETLRALPPRRAPRTLELRVLAELERRAALPWWRRSYGHWPLAVRVLFLLASAGLVKLAIMVAVWVMVGLDSDQLAGAFSTQFAWARAVIASVEGIADFCSLIFRSIPPLWLYSAAAFVASLYVALFGLGAAAYRTLYARDR